MGRATSGESGREERRGAVVSVTELRDGPIVRDDAVALALSLEARGHTLTTKDGVLTVSDGSKLTAEDRAAIARVRLHLMAIVGYDGPVPR